MNYITTNLAPEHSQGTVCSSSFKAVGYGCHQSSHSVSKKLAVLNTSLSSTPYPVTYRQHSQWHLSNPGSFRGLSGGVWTGTELRETRTLLRTSVPGPGPGPESCPCCWEKSLLWMTQRAGEGAGVRLALEEPVRIPGLGLINTLLFADQKQKH